MMQGLKTFSGRPLMKILFRTILLLVAITPSLARAQSEPFLMQTSPLPTGRGFHGAAVLGDFLYAFGGTVVTPDQQQRAAAFVNIARINPNSSLTNWGETTPLPEPRQYIDNSSIVLNDTVYIIGGSDAILGGNRSNTILWNRPNPNGALGQWRRSAPFDGVGVSCAAAFSTPGYLHLTGGTGQGDHVSNRVWSISLNQDGSPGRWEEAPSLPIPLWFHCAAVVGARAYVWGGLEHDEPGYSDASTKVFSSPVLGSGRLGPWRQEPVELPVGIYSAATAVAGPYLFAICPRYKGAKTSGDIWWTYVTPRGMEPWQRQETNITNQVYRATATDYRRGLIYITGGKGGTGELPQATTFRIKLSEKARQLAEQSWRGSQNAGEDSISSTEYAQAEASHGRQSQVSFDDRDGGTGALEGFYELDQARALSNQNRKPLVMYFNIDNAKPCIEQANYLAAEEFRAVQDRAVFASIDAIRFPQLTQQYGVFRVPTWILYDSNGVERDRLVGVIPPEKLTPKVTALP